MERNQALNNPDPLELERVSCGDLAGVGLQIAPGEIVCLSGASGSGKTRLLRAIADLEPHEGTVRLGALEQGCVPGHQWRRQVMMIPAESQWWFDTVGAHFARPVSEDLAALGFGKDVGDWQVSRLSSGEKQRLALIRAVSRQPRALLLDEPTANLDADSVRAVERWLQRLIREEGLPTIWVAHDAAQIKRLADRQLKIRGSRLEERQWA